MSIRIPMPFFAAIGLGLWAGDPGLGLLTAMVILLAQAFALEEWPQ